MEGWTNRMHISTLGRSNCYSCKVTRQTFSKVYAAVLKVLRSLWIVIRKARSIKRGKFFKHPNIFPTQIMIQVDENNWLSPGTGKLSHLSRVMLQHPQCLYFWRWCRTEQMWPARRFSVQVKEEGWNPTYLLGPRPPPAPHPPLGRLSAYPPP